MQAVILLLGGLAAVLTVILKTQGGLNAVVAEGSEANKFSLGAWRWSWSERTIPTVLTYGIVHYLGKFITFQVGTFFSLQFSTAVECLWQMPCSYFLHTLL